MSFLAAYDSLSEGERAGFLLGSIANDAQGTFAELQAARPILVSPGPVVITKHADCVEILGRHHDFSVRAYAPSMLRITGRFFLGEDDTELYERDVSTMRLAFRRDDLPGLVGMVRSFADVAIREVAPGPSGTFDAIGGLTRRVPAETIRAYFGLDGVSVETVQRWARACFWDIFANLPNDADISRAADVQATEMRAVLDGLIASRRDEDQVRRDTVLDRLLALADLSGSGFDDLAVRHNLIGLITGAVDTTSTAVVNILRELFARPDALDNAVRAVREGDGAALEALCFEALRLRPQAPMLLRTSEKPGIVAAGTERATMIPAGRWVLVAISSAMRDPDLAPEPDAFLPGRPSHLHLHFGDGLHSCFGRHLNRVQIVEIVAAMLRLPGLRLTGRERREGPFPDFLEVAYGPA